MAAPAEVTTKNLSGKYIMNKTLSDDSNAILTLQGVSWVTRKAISMATVTLHISHSPAANPETSADVIKIIQVLTGGIKGSTETRNLDFQTRGHTDHVFGEVEGRTRYLTGAGLPASGDVITRAPESADAADATDVKFLRAEVLSDLATPSNFLKEGGEQQVLVQSFVSNASAGWTAEQIWGFEEVEGLRRYTRRVVVRKGKQVIRARLVYDYQGPVELTE